MSLHCVVDASVAVDLFVPDPLSEKAIALFDVLAADSDSAFFVPDLFYSEVLSALRKYEQAVNDYAELEVDMALLVDFPLRVASCRELLITAAQISRMHMLSTYDSFYLALSQREGAPLITADERLVNGVRGKGFDVRYLVDVDLAKP